MPACDPIRILYMEDDRDTARLVQKRLERAGYVVDLAYDGEEGLAMYAARSYDAVAVDQTMPVHDGLEVIRILASRGPLPPTIMVTGTGDEAVAVEAMKLGAGDYIVKDVDGGYLELLPAVIERALSRQRMAEEKQRAEEALRQSEERYRCLVENIDLGITLVDTDHRIMMTNATIGKWFGRPVSEFVGKECFREFERREAVCSHCPGIRAMATGEAAEAETEGVREDGSRFPVRVQAFPLPGPDGAVSGFIEVVEDITERRRAEDELKRSFGELERFNRLAVGRELRMIELKREVNEMAAKAGLPPPYDLAFAEAASGSRHQG